MTFPVCTYKSEIVMPSKQTFARTHVYVSVTFRNSDCSLHNGWGRMRIGDRGMTDIALFGNAGLVYWDLTLPMFVLQLRNIVDDTP